MVKKNITFRIEESLIEKLNELRGNTSQNAFLEKLITSNCTSTSKETSNDDIQAQLQVQAEILNQMQVQVQLLVNQQSNIPTITPKTVAPLVPRGETRYDEDGIPYTVIDDTPDWKKQPIDPQAFYGKVPEPYTPGPYDDNPRKYFEDDDDEPIIPKKAIPAKDDDDDWRPF